MRTCQCSSRQHADDSCAPSLSPTHQSLSRASAPDILQWPVLAQALKTEGSPARGSPTHGGYNVQSTYFPEEPEGSGYVPPAHAAQAPAGAQGCFCHCNGCQ